jgi:hypothetical protein
LVVFNGFKSLKVVVNLFVNEVESPGSELLRAFRDRAGFCMSLCCCNGQHSCCEQQRNIAESFHEIFEASG